jgi:histidinol-phosphate aminotransferase
MKETETRADDPLMDLVRGPLRATVGYQVHHPTGIRVKLDANEMPFALPPEVRADLARELAALELNRYPDPTHQELRAELSHQVGVAPEALLIGNGSDEIIQMLITCFAEPRPGQARARIAYPSPTFVVFRGAALAVGCEPVEITTDPEADFALDPADLESAVAAVRPNIIFFARPNNPTGTLWPSHLVADLARHHPDVLVVSDEAYAAYAGDGMVAMLPELPNLLVMQTLSKVGLAGLRVGYLCGRPDLIAEVEKVRAPYNVGALNQRAALWILRHHRALLLRRCADVVVERERLAAALDRFDDLRVFTSHANLILFRVGRPGDGRATAVWQRLCERGVLIKCFDRPGPLSGCLRVTIGTGDENEIFLTALGEALAG